MKKKNYVWLLGLLLSVIAVGFTACSDDDGPGSSADLVGTWQGVTSTGWYKENGKIVEQWEDEVEDDYRVRFDEDGIAESFERYNGKWNGVEIGTWEYKDGKIYIYYGDEEIDVCTIRELTSSRLEWEYHDKSNEGGTNWEEYIIEVYRKISD